MSPLSLPPSAHQASELSRDWHSLPAKPPEHYRENRQLRARPPLQEQLRPAKSLAMTRTKLLDSTHHSDNVVVEMLVDVVHSGPEDTR